MGTDSRVCGMIEVTESMLLIRVSHTVQSSSPLTRYYTVEVITADEVDGRRRSNQQLIQKMVDSCQEPDKPDKCAPTHIRKG